MRTSGYSRQCSIQIIPGWPGIAHLRADPFEDAQIESPMHLRWMADNMWLFVPIQEKLMEFFDTLESYPFQRGQSLDVNVNYNTLKLQKVMKELELSSPIN